MLGDSGGPLLIPDRPDGNITAGFAQADLIVGITSFGSEACDAAVPGLYTKISYFQEWISEIIDGKKPESQVIELNQCFATCAALLTSLY